MLGFRFVQISNNQIVAQGQIISNMGRGNYGVQYFGEDGKPSESIPVRVLSSDHLVENFLLFPTEEGITAWFNKLAEAQSEAQAEDTPRVPLDEPELDDLTLDNDES